MSEKLLFAVMVAMPLIGIRIIYAIAIAFKDHSASGGSMAYGLFLELSQSSWS
jgi:hypothetical protein